ncbi:MAG: hypothetical protein LBS49_05755, partial [Candidatus Accumulibacter sp.]|nr:hypothetical protein [Accumulibacter sp.]
MRWGSLRSSTYAAVSAQAEHHAIFRAFIAVINTMRNATRRNRNIGTVKQGHGQNNRMRIAEPYFSVGDWRSHTERLTHYKKFVRAVQGHEFTFVVEKTRAGCCHACSIEDVVFMLEQIPAADYGDLRLIVFRQPKHKEGILSPVWGWLCYEYQFENTCAPAVILEAFNLAEYLTHSRKLSIDARDEFDRLQQDGHVFIADRRGYRAKLTRETVRATQLYRTLPHEFGHYVHYRQ